MENEDLKKKCEEYLNSWKRERADFINYKKEELERIKGVIGYAGEEMILKILPILDNFEIAEKSIPDDLKKDEHIKGLIQIKQQMLDFLKSQGVEPINVLGEKFDPNLHEAIGETSPSDLSAEASAKVEALAKGGESGIIVEEIKKGYKINNRLLRPAKVKISK